jgi:hypothetical protein
MENWLVLNASRIPCFVVFWESWMCSKWISQFRDRNMKTPELEYYEQVQFRIEESIEF